MKWIVIVVLALAVSAIVAGQVGLLQGNAPTDLGVQQGKLKGLSSTEHSVSSQADLYLDHPQRKYSSIAPLAVRGATAGSCRNLQQTESERCKPQMREVDFSWAVSIGLIFRNGLMHA